MEASGVVIIASGFVVVLHPALTGYGSTGLLSQAHSNSLPVKDRSLVIVGIITTITTCQFSVKEKGDLLRWGNELH